jgi:hypothetical protein
MSGDHGKRDRGAPSSQELDLFVILNDRHRAAITRNRRRPALVSPFSRARAQSQRRFDHLLYPRREAASCEECQRSQKGRYPW